MYEKNKVFFEITIEANTGSTGRASEALCDALASEGWNCIIAYGRTNHQSKHKTYKIGHRLDQLWHGAISRLFDAHGLGSRLATRRLIKFIKASQPSVIHLRNIHGYYLHYPTLFDYLATVKIPVLWTLHDAWSFTGHCSHFAAVGCDKWKTGCGGCPQVQEYPKSIVLDRSSQNYALKKQYFTQVPTLQLICVSHWLTDKVKQSFFGDKAPIHTIVNGVNTEIFKPLHDPKAIEAIRQKYGITAPKVILAVARPWSRKKGFYDILQLSELLAQSQAASEVQVVMVGINNREKRYLPKNVVGIHRTENLSDLCALYNLADVYLNASVEESFGLTTVESLACGTPVIGYDNTGTREILSGIQGLDTPDLLSHTGNVQALFENVSGLLRMEKIRNLQDSQSAVVFREHILVNYNKNRQLNEYLGLINSVR
jgi:putative colanic acid biosynthesis glycosyltransferase